LNNVDDDDGVNPLSFLLLLVYDEDEDDVDVDMVVDVDDVRIVPPEAVELQLTSQPVLLAAVDSASRLEGSAVVVVIEHVVGSLGTSLAISKSNTFKTNDGGLLSLSVVAPALLYVIPKLSGFKSRCNIRCLCKYFTHSDRRRKYKYTKIMMIATAKNL